MITAIALDDEPMALEVIKIFCSKIPFLKLTHTFTQVSLAKKHLRNFPVDLIFLDIHMPEINGVQFSKDITPDIMVIFTTAYSQYAIEGFDVKALDYLLKPFEFIRFEQACIKAKENYTFYKTKNNVEENYLLVRSEYALVKILINDILYFETLDDYIKIHPINKKPILTLMSMKKILEKLPPNKFIRVHRSFTVAINKIDSVRNKAICLGSIEIPIGISYEKDFFKLYKDNFI